MDKIEYLITETFKIARFSTIESDPLLTIMKQKLPESKIFLFSITGVGAVYDYEAITYDEYKILVIISNIIPTITSHSTTCDLKSIDIDIDHLALFSTPLTLLILNATKMGCVVLDETISVSKTPPCCSNETSTKPLTQVTPIYTSKTPPYCPISESETPSCCSDKAQIKPLIQATLWLKYFSKCFSIVIQEICSKNRK